jgi:hypothetical protein
MTAPTTTSPSTTEPPRLRALQIETQTALLNWTRAWTGDGPTLGFHRDRKPLRASRRLPLPDTRHRLAVAIADGCA